MLIERVETRGLALPGVSPSPGIGNVLGVAMMVMALAIVVLGVGITAKAAGHPRGVSENERHKFERRSAVGRVGRQSNQTCQQGRSEAAGRRAIAFLVSLLRSGRS